MVRFTGPVVVDKTASSADDFRAWRDLEELDSSSDEEESSSSSDESSEEDEPPHPLGFGHPSYGRTRFFLDRPRETTQQIRVRLGYRRGQQHDFMQDEIIVGDNKQQSFPPASYYLDRRTAPTKALLMLSSSSSMKQHDIDDDSIDKVTQLLQAASVVDKNEVVPKLLLSDQQQQQSRLLDLATLADRELGEIRKRSILQEQSFTQQHLEAAQALKSLMKREEEEALKVIKLEKEERKKRDAALQAFREQEEADEAERERVAAEEREKDELAEKERQAKDQLRRDEKEARRKAAAEEEAKKTEYIAKAKRLVAKLVELRASVEPFEKDKQVSKRRLHMKKTVRGKVNTLNPDPEKIKSIAAEVVNEINLAREEDEQNKQQAQSGNTQITTIMTRGKRYLVDLLASTAMVRCQAEGFNGTRGDGFPLASMLAIVSTECKELVPILGAHIYTACPTAIPTLPHPSKDSTEEELMEGLGMAKDKKGDYESFERFLARTEGIVSLVAEIMASKPDSHVLLGGHTSSIEWLDRFLQLLPPPPETLPLLTAPVLDAFLTGAGHMMANLFPDQFKTHLDTIMNDTIHRLDEGPIGEPRALRLKKTVKGGFDHFKNDFPSKAVPSLYLTSSGDGGVGPPVAPMTTSPERTKDPFGSSQGAAANAAANPFGMSTQTSTGSVFNAPSAASPFSQPTQTSGGMSSTPFGFSNMATSGDDDMAISHATPINSASPFGQSMGTASTFVGGQAPAPSPFTNTNSPFGQPSGQTASVFGTTAASPFGTSANAGTTGPFGASSSQQTPFGNPFGGAQQSKAPFGQGSSTAFAGSSSSNQYGGGGGQRGNRSSNKPPCKFFAQGKCRFGSNCRFSHDTPQSNTGGFGQSGGFSSNPFG